MNVNYANGITLIENNFNIHSSTHLFPKVLFSMGGGVAFFISPFVEYLLAWKTKKQWKHTRSD